jgi:hypothetical protein
MTWKVEHDISAYGGTHAVRLSNGDVELVASTDYGPRILRYANLGSENVFGFLDRSEQGNDTPFGERWHIYGGHRLWHAPEHPIRSYVPDNGPVAVSIEGRTLVLTQPEERMTFLRKEMRLTLAEEGSRVVIEHRITNASDRGVDLAVWALSFMAPGGHAIFPNPPYVPHPEGLLPVQRIVTWPYTRLSDPRLKFGDRFVRVAQEATARTPQKIGLWDAHHGWAAYAVGDRLFIKRYTPAARDTPLVDLGCNVETFTDARILELETLGPLEHLEPGRTSVHVETWELFVGVALPDDDAATEATLLRLINAGEGP